MVSIEEKVIEFVRKYAGIPIFSRKIDIFLKTDLDSDLRLEKEEVEDLMEDYFKQFKVNPDRFNIDIYYPEEEFHFINDFLAIFIPSKRKPPITVPDFTVEMLINSAKAGHWLYG